MSSTLAVRLGIGVVAGAALCLGLPAAPYAQGKGRTASSHDWIQGVWESQWPGDQLAKPGGPKRPVEVGPAPLKPEYLVKYQADQKAIADASKRGEPIAGENVTECLPEGFPAMMAPGFPMEVIATPKQVNMTQEAYSQTRRIYLDRKQMALDDAEPQFYGHSVGHWEGNDLVVNTIAVKERVKMRGVPHSPAMRVDERMYSTGPDTFEDKITVTDPQYLTAPWTFTYHYKRKPGYDLNEYICENNHEYADPKTGAQKLDIQNVFGDR
jgi:hypothetical protein